MLQADEINLHPGFRAADPRPQPFIGPILAGTKGVLMAVPWPSVAGYGALGAGIVYTKKRAYDFLKDEASKGTSTLEDIYERALDKAVNSARTVIAEGEGSGSRLIAEGEGSGNRLIAKGEGSGSRLIEKGEGSGERLLEQIPVKIAEGLKSGQ